MIFVGINNLICIFGKNHQNYITEKPGIHVTEISINLLKLYFFSKTLKFAYLTKNGKTINFTDNDMNVIEKFIMYLEFRFQQFPTRIKLHSIHSNVKHFDWLAGSDIGYNFETTYLKIDSGQVWFKF